MTETRITDFQEVETDVLYKYELRDFYTFYCSFDFTKDGVDGLLYQFKILRDGGTSDWRLPFFTISKLEGEQGQLYKIGPIEDYPEYLI